MSDNLYYTKTLFSKSGGFYERHHQQTFKAVAISINLFDSNCHTNKRSSNA